MGILEDAEKVARDLGKTVSNLQGQITGANVRIGLYEKEIRENNEEIRQLQKFKGVVESDHLNFDVMLKRKRTHVHSSGLIYNMRCAKVYQKAMEDRLSGIREKSTKLLYSSIESSITVKLTELQSRQAVLGGLVSAENISIGKWQSAISGSNREIERLKRVKE